MTQEIEMKDKLTFDEVCTVVAETLGVGDRAGTWTPDTELFGNLPELDSLAVVEVVAALESRFDIDIEAEDLTIETFASFGSLHEFVVARSGAGVAGESVAR